MSKLVDGDTTIFVEKSGFNSYNYQIPLEEFSTKTQEYIKKKVQEVFEEQE